MLSTTVLAQGYAVKKIVIDAGHGGKDPGAIGSKCKEKDIALKVALLTGKYIEDNLDDVEVIYTRKKDVYPTLNERAELANKVKADLFISIHCNSVPSSKAYGTETLVLGTNRSKSNLRVEQQENSVITLEDNYEETYKGFDPNSDESYIIFNHIHNVYLEQSTTLATLVQEQYAKRVGRHDRKVQQACLWVLSETSMPAILTELGFISNPEEQRFLMSQQGQEYMASAIFRAIRDYKQIVESKQNLTQPKSQTAVQSSTNDQNSKSVENDTSTGLVYKLQILSSATILEANDPSIKGVEQVGYYKDGDWYKYTIGNSPNINDVINLKNKYKKKYKGSFVIAFLNGKRIPISEAKKILEANSK